MFGSEGPRAATGPGGLGIKACHTLSGLRIARVTGHAVQRYCQRRHTNAGEARRRISLLAQSAEAIDTPSGPALALGIERLGFACLAGKPAQVAILTYYVLDLPSAVREYYQGIRPLGMPRKDRRSRRVGRHTKRRALAQRAKQDGTPYGRGVHRGGRPYTRKPRSRLASELADSEMIALDETAVVSTLNRGGLGVSFTPVPEPSFRLGSHTRLPYQSHITGQESRYTRASRAPRAFEH